MKRFSTIILIIYLLFFNCIFKPEKQDNGNEAYLPGWELIWQDEFDSKYINSNHWEFEVNAWGGGNNELQYYTNRPQNAFIRDGKLVIRALKETYTGPEGTREYTSARLRTKNKGDWKYVRVDVKAKLPYGQGLWPAIWMLPTDQVYGGWPASGEIDIMELLGHEPNKIYGTIHYLGMSGFREKQGGFYVLPGGDFSSGFHVFTIVWDSLGIKWYVDNKKYFEVTGWNSPVGPFPAPFDQRFHLILNVAVGGDWPGSPDETTVFPQEMEVDYVRVYRKK